MDELQDLLDELKLTCTVLQDVIITHNEALTPLQKMVLRKIRDRTKETLEAVGG